MSRWSDKASNHPIYNTVAKAKEYVYIEIGDIDSSHEQEQNRLIKFLDKITEVLESIDLDLFPEAEFTSINNHLKQPHFMGQLSAYSSDVNIQHLKTANDHINVLLPKLFSIASVARSPEAREEIKKAEVAFEHFCETVEEKKKETFKDFAEIKNDLDELKDNGHKISLEFNKIKSDYFSQIEKLNSEFAANETERKNDYSAAKIKRDESFSHEMISIKKNAVEKISDIKNDYEDTFKNAFGNFSEDLKNKIDDADEKHKSILNLHNLVAKDGVAGGYESNADKEQESANNWRLISFGCYFLILLWVVFKERLGFHIILNDEYQIPAVVLVLSITGVAFVAAQYASRQSRIHRINEQRMRWFALEVQAIDPFISSLDSEQQNDLKRRLTERLFGQDRVVDDGNRESSDSKNAINDLANAITKLVKRD